MLNYHRGYHNNSSQWRCALLYGTARSHTNLHYIARIYNGVDLGVLYVGGLVSDIVCVN